MASFPSLHRTLIAQLKPCAELARHRLYYHHLISQSTVSAAGPPLVNAVVDAQSQLYCRGSATVVNENPWPVAVANGVRSALVQEQGGRRFMLEGVSVDPGRTMSPVSPQISLRVESSIHGDRGMLPSSTSVRILFHPALPGTRLLSILLEGGGFGWMSYTRAARVWTARRRTRRSVCGFRAKAASERRRR